MQAKAGKRRGTKATDRLDPRAMSEAQLAEALGLSGLPSGLDDEGEVIAALGSEGADLYLAAVELGRRHLSRSRPPQERLVRAGAAAGVLRPMLAGLKHEEFWGLYLNARLELIKAVRIASGGLTQCSISPREALAPALVHSAAAVIFAHNHPSGDPSPSGADLQLNDLLNEGGRVLGVRVVDHLIIADGSAHSAVEGRIEYGGEE